MTATHAFRFAAASAVLLLAGCASSHILTGTPRAPIDPAQVRVYYGAPPVAFEEVAILETSSGALTYGEQNKTNAVLRKLREEAASLGANGILFQGTADGHGGRGVSVGAGGGRFGGSSHTSAGIGVSISPRQKLGRGVAIYVPNPPPLQAPVAPTPAP
ncbi:hypothetical protein [Luteimonas sp. MC1825]|uniref:hypothetical protein n=1 Tax=Luteimonas sp. MC1825 TaxID=2761107 RepID=UPI0016096693|nr:hypothetical protein [Luteimonas sp. MC1825]MBB6600406.1 hypothetical protein [Luteimonas sp. MC1825]QOC88077.1 hypothetical protein IDM46_12820 [Luteimonas sp. MC1825]